jgi:hypothetical protein
MEASPETDVRHQAMAQLKRKQEFRAAIAAYVVVNAALWIIWALSDERGDANGIPWPLWVTAFWGLGMVLSAWNVYGQKPISDAEVDAEVRKIQSGT